MNRFVFQFICFAIMIGLGYGLVAISEYLSAWDDDQKLIARFERTISRSVPESPENGRKVSDHSALRFVECSETGIDFFYDQGTTGKFHLAETLGGGVAATDFDLDGTIDLVFVDGGDPASKKLDQTNRLSLYRQMKPETFSRVSKQARLEWFGYGHGCLAGDFNNDGFDDLLISCYQSLALFINQGDGTFEERSSVSGLKTSRWCASAACGDLDGDGDLDLYVTGYAQASRTAPAPFCELRGERVHCNPHYYEVVPDLLFENQGDGSFTDRSEESGIASEAEYGLGVVIADTDHDLIPEIMVANDGDRNLQFQRQGNWKYRETGLASGLAYDSEGHTMGAMGIACADFDGNGLPDLLTTNFYNERNVIFSNIGKNSFVDRSLASVIDQTSRDKVGWACLPIDADNDGYLDLFVANGHVGRRPGEPFRQMAMFYGGLPGGQWELAKNPGPYFEKPWHGRGAIAADVTGDLRPDIVVSHLTDRAAVLRNESLKNGKALTLKCIGVESNRSATTTRIEVKVNGRVMVHQIVTSTGYLSSSTAPLHIGVGDADAVEVLTIYWQSGRKQVFHNVRCGVSFIAVEGHDVLIPKGARK